VVSYMLYLFIASTTIASPGPGVVMTLTNSLKYGLKESVSGILGVALGMLIIAILVGGGMGVVVAKSEALYNLLKIIGAVYLFYLGIKLIKNRNNEIEIEDGNLSLNKTKSFIHGLGITVINPKPILFFIALFPQFIKEDQAYFPQFVLLTITFCILIVIIHVFYGLFASFLKSKASGLNYFKYVNTVGGSAYILFSLSLLFLTKKV